jgi:hypothetical protein
MKKLDAYRDQRAYILAAPAKELTTSDRANLDSVERKYETAKADFWADWQKAGAGRNKVGRRTPGKRKGKKDRM